MTVGNGEREGMRLCAAPPPRPVFRQSRDSHDVTTTHPTLVIPKPGRLWRGVWGTGETCVFYLIITFFLLLSAVSFLQIGQRSRGFLVCINTGGSRRRPLLVRFERVLVSVLVGKAARFVFSLSRIPRYTWPHSISATQSIAFGGPRLAGWIYLGGVSRDGTAATGWQAGWQAGRSGKGKDCASRIDGLRPDTPNIPPPLVDFSSYFFLVTLCYLLPLSCHLVFFSLLIWRGYLAGVWLRERRRVRVWSPTGSRMEPAMGNKQK